MNCVKFTSVACLLCLLFLPGTPAIAQIPATPVTISDTVKLPQLIVDRPLGWPVSSVNIIDARPDTTTLGYYANRKEKSKYVLSSATTPVLSHWVSSYLGINEGTGTGGQLFMFIRKLRISEEVMVRIHNNNRQGQPMDGWERGVLLKADFFLNRDSVFYPLYRYDTAIDMIGVLPAEANNFLATALTESLVKLFSVNWELLLSKGKRLKYHDILDRINKDSEAPVLTASLYKKGVYMNFEEFKTNAPSVAEYELQTGKYGDMLYVKGKDGLEAPERNAWGYCDGKNLFINSGDKYSVLVPQGKTFYFMGLKSVVRRAKHIALESSGMNYALDNGKKRSVYRMDIRPYELDMDTGEPY